MFTAIAVFPKPNLISYPLSECSNVLLRLGSEPNLPICDGQSGVGLPVLLKVVECLVHKGFKVIIENLVGNPLCRVLLKTTTLSLFTPQRMRALITVCAIVSWARGWLVLHVAVFIMAKPVLRTPP